MLKFGLRSRLVISYTVIITMIIALLSYFFYGRLSEIILQRSMETSNEMLQRVDNSVNQMMRELNLISAQVIYNSEFQSDFDDAFANPDSYESLAQKNRFYDILSTLNGPSFIAEQINVFNLKGDFISYGLKTDPYDDLKDIIHRSDWIPKTIQKNGDLQLVPPHRDEWYKSGETVFSLARLFPNQNGGSPRIVEVQQRYDKLKQVIGSPSDSSSSNLYIWDGKGNLFYPAPADRSGPQLEWKDVSSAPANAFQSAMKSFDGEDYMVTWHRSSVYGFTIAAVQPESVLLSPIQSLRNIVIVVTVLAEAVALLSAYLLAFTITQPVRRILQYVKYWDVDRMNKRLQSKFYRWAPYEIRDLYDEFNEMKSRLSQSIDQMIEVQQRENLAQLRILQTQLQPHFVFNTLSSIGVLAENSGAQTAATMCYKMMGMMEYASRTDYEVTEVKDEITFMIQYLDLMKLRYQDKFEYEVEVEEALAGQSIPRFVLQPIVENSFAHGFKQIYPPWKIRVEIRRAYGQVWDIRIRDNGTGFTPEAQARLQKFIDGLRDEPARATKQVGSKAIGGLGLENVLMRLYLFQKGEIRFSLQNLEEGMELWIRMGEREELADV